MRHILALTLLLSWPVGFAFAGETLQLDEVLQRVKSYHPDLKMKQADKDIAKYTKREAWGRALPNISGQVRHMQNFDVPKFNIPGQGTFQMMGDYMTEYSVTVNQALYTFGAVRAALSAAEKGLQMVDLDYEATQQNVEYQAKVAFYQVLLAQTNLGINQRLLDNAKANLNILQKSFQGGRPPQGDLIRLQADVENKKPMVENAQAELRATKIALSLLMSDQPSYDYDITGDLAGVLPILSSPQLKQNFEDQSPVLHALEKNIELQHKLADIEFSSTLPQLGAFYTYNQQNNSFSSRFASDMRLTTSAVGVALKWDLWDGGTSRASYQKAKVTAERARYDLSKTKDNMNRQLLSALEQYNTYRKNVGYLEKAVSLARRSFKLSQNRFRAGRTSITELNDTQNLLLQSEMQQAANLFQMNMTFALMESIVGRDLQ